MISAFFIHRPNFAIVIAIVITIVGLVCMRVIPIAQYPNITPPQVTISITYPGASAQTIANVIAEPVEEQVNGAPDELYMQSSEASSGTYSLTVTFAIGSDPNIDQVNVQNRVQVAEAQLPAEVQSEGITVRAASSTQVMIVSLFSRENRFDQVYISNYVYTKLQQVIARLPGVGNTQIFGQRQYAMRIWMNPMKMTGLGITTADVIAAIQAQNIQVAAGQIGAPPAASNQQQQLTVLAPGELTSAEQFRDIVIRADPSGGIVHLSDIARVELAAQQYTTASTLDRYATASLAVYQAPSANAMQVAQEVQAALKKMAPQLPQGLEYTIAFNNASFISANITEIVRTLIITLVLVVAVVFIFLQDWRATIIPTIAIPVSLIGVFAVLYVLGYSANTIDMFAIVLAITLVVDDAIVVVENVKRNMEQHPELSPTEATEKAMAEITGPVVATTLVLVAVFAPVGLVSGITGALYRQFATTISVSVVISAINALTLSPALCALMLKPPRPTRFKAFLWFNRGFGFVRDKYAAAVLWLSRRLVLSALCIGLAFAAAYGIFSFTPSSFLPAEDQGYFQMSVALPNGASLERSSAVVARLTKILDKTPGVAHVVGITGLNVVSQAQQAGYALILVILKPWADRSAAESAEALMAKLKPKFDAIPSAEIAMFDPASIPGISATGGINFVLEAQNGQSFQQLGQAARGLIFATNQDKRLSGMFTAFSANQPQVQVTVNTDRAELLGVSPQTVYQTMQAYLGSQYVNLFNYNNFVFQVDVQADQQFRSKISDIDNLYVRSATGAQVPLTSLVTIKSVQGADAATLYNEYPAVLVNGRPAPGYSDGQAIAAMEQAAAKHLAKGYGYEWTGLTYQEILAGSQEADAFIFALIFSFLFMVALYEGWFLPLAVMLPVVFALVGGLIFLRLRGMALDVYGQIGLVLLIGLAAKNAILIVEFAKDRLDAGDIGIVEAAEEGSRARYRPVMMTALAFIIGVLPLVFATGAGGAARQSIGTTVFSGMILASVLGVLFIGPLFVMAARASAFFKRNSKPKNPKPKKHFEKAPVSPHKKGSAPDPEDQARSLELPPDDPAEDRI